MLIIKEIKKFTKIDKKFTDFILKYTLQVKKLMIYFKKYIETRRKNNGLLC